MGSSPAASSCSGWSPKLDPGQSGYDLPSYGRTSAANVATEEGRSSGRNDSSATDHDLLLRLLGSREVHVRGAPLQQFHSLGHSRGAAGVAIAGSGTAGNRPAYACSVRRRDIRRLRAEAPRLPDDPSVVQRTRPSSCSLLAWDCVSARLPACNAATCISNVKLLQQSGTKGVGKNRFDGLRYSSWSSTSPAGCLVTRRLTISQLMQKMDEVGV